ncbi:hypothetical protein [uncultured Methylobacterium sp.]|uniref:hypothetical protein n=1 Tax=uncultured Methylobacterium sp. TaxID=157278 RepID=UPI0035C9703C
MFGSDGSPVVQYVSIFAVIFAVLTVIVLAVRRLGGGGLAQAGRGGQRGRQPRLGIVDVYELDRQRQLILLRRDNVEHLLLVGGPNDVVIERHIQRGQRDPGLRPEAMAEPRPDAIPGASDAALPGLEEQRPEPFFPPSFEMPVVLGPTAPGSSAAPPVTHPLDAAALDLAAATERADAVVPASRPDPAARRPLRRTAPPLLSPHPDVASERERPDAAPADPIPALPPAERRAIDPAILADMARQLEEALARPASAVTPPPAARQAPATESPAEHAATDPVADATASTPVEPAPRDGEPDDALFEEPPQEPEPFLPDPPEPAAPVAEAPPPVPEPPPHVAPAADPVAQAEPPRAEPPSQPEPPPSAPAQKSSANPFSVEEIEAEFARLLGRPLDKRN